MSPIENNHAKVLNIASRCMGVVLMDSDHKTSWNDVLQKKIDIKIEEFIQFTKFAHILAVILDAILNNQKVTNKRAFNIAILLTPIYITI